jgi:peptidoglycan/LPS O-acetylase OafA/YrhL
LIQESGASRAAETHVIGRNIDRASAPTLADVYQGRWNNFDFLRFGLATAVIWSHCYALSGRSMDPVFAFTRQIDAGSLAVDCFFILSGFLITQSWVSDPTLRDYAIKRALRLVPALVVALVFGALIVGPLVTPVPLSTYFTSWNTWAHFDGVIFHRHLGSPLLFADNPLPNWLNSSLWSLRYEVFCYGLIAAFGMLRGVRWPVVSPLVLAVALAGQMLLVAGGHGGSITETTLRLVACFFAGSTLFVARDRLPFSPLLAAGAALVLLTAARAGGFRYLLPLAGGYLLLFLAIWPALGLQRFGRYGDFSYGLYVFAYPIQQAIMQVAGPAISIGVFFLLAFTPTLLLAALSWHFIEAPALARKPARRVGRVPAPAPRPTSASWAVTSPEGSS